MKNFLSVLIVLSTVFIAYDAKAQLPCQNGPDGIIYIQNLVIQNYDPSLPASATNPSTNTIPNGGGGLAVANNLNGPGPSPTFYSTSGGNWIYWNGTTWVNTGHSAGATVNPGGGGNYLYNLNGGTGDVWQYDGTGPSTLLLTVPGFTGGGPYDLVGDCDGGFYILRTLNTGTPAPFLRKYSSTGVLLQSWTATGTSNTAGGGFAIIGNTVYYHNGGGFHSGTIGPGTNIAFSPITNVTISPSDMACCPVCNSGIDTLYYCQGAPPVNLTTNLPGAITWTVHAGAANVVGIGTSVQVTASSTALIVATSSASTTTDSFRVIAVTATLDAGQDGIIPGCDPFADTLNATLLDTNGSIAYSIAWAPVANIVSGGNTLTPAISQTAATTYTITVSTPATEGGCSWSDTVGMDIDNFTPFANFEVDLGLGCINDTVAFTNTSITNPNGSATFFWTFGDGNFSAVKNPTHIYGVQGNYPVRLTVTDRGCTDDTIINVDVRHPLVADFGITNNGLGGDDSICLGGAFVFSPITTPLPGTAPMTFDWYFGDGTVRLNDGPLQQVYQFANPGIYSVKLVLTDTLGCQDSMVKSVFVDIPAFVRLAAQPTEICVGDKVYFTDSVAPNTFNTVYDFGDGNILSGLHNPAHVYKAAGVYNVNFEGQYLVCPNADTTITITVNEYPLVELGDDITLCPGVDTAAVLRDVVNPSRILSWSTGVSAPSITVPVEQTGRYWARADNNGCVGTDSIWIKRDCYLNIPNSFSPNGDGMNDYFIPRQLLSSGLTGFDMKIFNRWGELIFQTNNLNGRGWDGTFGGKEQPVGVYVYLIEAKWKNGFTNQFQGNVSLLR